MSEWRSEWYEDEHGNGWRYTEDDEGNWEHETWGPDDEEGGGSSGCFATLAPAVVGVACVAAVMLLRKQR